MIKYTVIVLSVLSLVFSSSIKSKEICPDGSLCSDISTCCPLNDGFYGCCYHPNAICCADLKNCCPQGTRCSGGYCLPLENYNVTLKTAIKKKTEIHCFGTEYVCPDDSTCCQGVEASTYGCCPMKNAVCCQDHRHCCPEGMTCDLESQKCLGKGHFSLMYDFNKTRDQTQSSRKFAVLTKSSNGSNVVCPGSEFQCPDSYTCCTLQSGDWGCCPFANAACCLDHVHCCPGGMKCDASSQACEKKGQFMESAPKIPAQPLSLSVVCPDKSSCSEFSTCCKMNSSKYGCCPYPNADCCSDGIHCCPYGFMCDVKSKQCVPKKETPVVEDYHINMI